MTKVFKISVQSELRANVLREYLTQSGQFTNDFKSFDEAENFRDNMIRHMYGDHNLEAYKPEFSIFETTTDNYI